MPPRCLAASSTDAALPGLLRRPIDRARWQAPARDGGRELLHPLLRDGVALEPEVLNAGQAALVEQRDERPAAAAAEKARKESCLPIDL